MRWAWATQVLAVAALMAIREINFDGIIGPSHNYAGLSLGNLASTRNAGRGVAAARGGACRASTRCAPIWRWGWRQGIFVPQPRPDRAWLAELGTTIEDAEPVLAANAMSASAMWAANAATVSPAPRHRRRQLPPDRRQFAEPCRTAATNGRRRWRSCSSLSPTTAFRGPRAGPAGVRRRGRGQSHAAARPRTASPASRCSSTASRAAPSRRASISKRRRRSRACTGSIPSARSSSSNRTKRSPPARSTTTSSPSPTSACCSRTRRPSPTATR